MISVYLRAATSDSVIAAEGRTKSDARSARVRTKVISFLMDFLLSK